jgi:hypothetical protein
LLHAGLSRYSTAFVYWDENTLKVSKGLRGALIRYNEGTDLYDVTPYDASAMGSQSPLMRSSGEQDPGTAVVWGDVIEGIDVEQLRGVVESALGGRSNPAFPRRSGTKYRITHQAPTIGTEDNRGYSSQFSAPPGSAMNDLDLVVRTIQKLGGGAYVEHQPGESQPTLVVMDDPATGTDYFRDAWNTLNDAERHPAAMRALKHNPAASSVHGRGWIQESYETSGGEAKKRAATLRKLGYQVSVGSMGRQVTPVGSINLTMVYIRPGTSGDAYLEGVPPVEEVRWHNPAASPEQYRLAQAVLSGTARETGMSPAAAREIVERTPAGLRSEYSRHNPDYRGLTDAFDAGKTFRTSGAYYETGVANARVVKYGFNKWLNEQSPGAKYAHKRLKYTLLKEFMEGWAAGKRAEEWRRGYSDTMGERHSNPADGAAEMYETFHGVPSGSETVITEEIQYHGNLAELGKLIELKVTTLSGYKVVLDFSNDGVLLCVSEDGRQLYFRGGRQDLDLAAIDMNADEFIKDLMVIGDITEASYETAKKADGLKKLTYFHRLRDKEGAVGTERVYPMLLYDTLNAAMSVAGGSYATEERGLVG